MARERPLIPAVRPRPHPDAQKTGEDGVRSHPQFHPGAVQGEAIVSGWIFAGAVVAVVVGLLALDWFMAGRAGGRLRALRGKPRITSSQVDYAVLQAEIRRADSQHRTLP